MDRFTKITPTEIRREQTTTVSSIIRREDVMRELRMLHERRKHEIAMLDKRITEWNALLKKCDEFGVK